MNNHEYAFLLDAEQTAEENIEKLLRKVRENLVKQTQHLLNTMDMQDMLSFTDMMRGTAQEELRKLDNDASERWRVSVRVSKQAKESPCFLEVVAKKRSPEEIKMYENHLARKERLREMVARAAPLQMPDMEG